MMLNNVIVWDIKTVPDLKGFGGAERGSCLAAGRHDGPCAAVGFSERAADDLGSWRAIFLINLPLAAATILLRRNRQIARAGVGLLDRLKPARFP